MQGQWGSDSFYSFMIWHSQGLKTRTGLVTLFIVNESRAEDWYQDSGLPCWTTMIWQSQGLNTVTKLPINWCNAGNDLNMREGMRIQVHDAMESMTGDMEHRICDKVKGFKQRTCRSRVCELVIRYRMLYLVMSSILRNGGHVGCNCLN